MPQKKAGRRGILSVKMTGQEIIAMAVNTIQNRLHEVERDSQIHPSTACCMPTTKLCRPC